MTLVKAALLQIESSMPYHMALLFIAFYPICSSLTWVTTALVYAFRRERGRADEPVGLSDWPPVSILIAAYCEELHIDATIQACLAVDYPKFELVIVDDGSTDDTVAKVTSFLGDGRVRLVAKEHNEGKAMALNDGLLCTAHEIVVVMDADACPEPAFLRHLVPHFASPRVAAVTGNPRVVDPNTFLAKLQTLEFTSIVSVQRRAQRVWGRILTMSGVVTALRKSALADVGLFSPEMATEDIDLTWKLQMRYYDVRYEPAAVVWMHVPQTLEALWNQRRRWALGLSQVMRRHGRGVASWKRRRMWPVAIESVMSILWAYTFVVMVCLWALSYLVGLPPVGASPFPNWWGMVIATMSVAQLGTGVALDRHYDRNITRYFPYAVFYPLVYWMLMALVTVVSTPRGLLRKTVRPTVWRTTRVEAARTR